MTPAPTLELGLDHTLTLVSFGQNERFGAVLCHPNQKRPGEWCLASIIFDSEDARVALPDRPKWTVVQWEPLDITPSFQCNCGDHGFVRDGKWVPA